MFEIKIYETPAGNRPFEKYIEKLKDEYALTLAKSYFQGMKRIGLGKAESIKYLERIDE